jgi:hypothetical protein
MQDIEAMRSEEANSAALQCFAKQFHAHSRWAAACSSQAACCPGALPAHLMYLEQSLEHGSGSSTLPGLAAHTCGAW